MTIDLEILAMVNSQYFQTHLISFLRECANHNTNDFGLLVDQLSPEEMLVVRQVVSGGN